LREQDIPNNYRSWLVADKMKNKKAIFFRQVATLQT
jgi:hypothetical protein